MRIVFAAVFALLLSVTVSAQTDPKDEQIAKLSQAVQKLADEVEVSRDLLKVKDDQIALQEKLLGQKDELIEAYKAESAAKQKVVDILTAIKCNETTIAFKPFGWSIVKRVKKVCY